MLEVFLGIIVFLLPALIIIFTWTHIVGGTAFKIVFTVANAIVLLCIIGMSIGYSEYEKDGEWKEARMNLDREYIECIDTYINEEDGFWTALDECITPNVQGIREYLSNY